MARQVARNGRITKGNLVGRGSRKAVRFGIGNRHIQLARLITSIDAPNRGLALDHESARL
jgi:hypothetical protein